MKESGILALKETVNGSLFPMAWYDKVYTGVKAQYMRQGSFAVISLLLLVILPGSIDYIMVREGKKYVGSSQSTGKVVREDRIK